MSELIEVEITDYYESDMSVSYTITTVNGEEMPCINSDAASILEMVLDHLGYDVEIKTNRK